MIKTKDQKKFFTYEQNLPQLFEFSKIFGAEISVVKIPETTEILTLEELAPALCEKKTQKSDYQILKQVNKKQTRRKIISRAAVIQKLIRELLMSNEAISLGQLNKMFKKYKLTLACLCNHFRIARSTLESQGFRIKKIKTGQYKLEK